MEQGTRHALRRCSGLQGRIEVCCTDPRLGRAGAGAQGGPVTGHRSTSDPLSTRNSSPGSTVTQREAGLRKSPGNGVSMSGKPWLGTSEGTKAVTGPGLGRVLRATDGQACRTAGLFRSSVSPSPRRCIFISLPGPCLPSFSLRPHPESPPAHGNPCQGSGLSPRSSALTPGAGDRAEHTGAHLTMT